MNKLEQAARQALEALSNIAFPVGDKRNEAITALREALAEQAEQSQLADATLEPVAWVDEHGLFSTINPNNNDWLPLYTRPVRTKDPCHPWQDLTDDEIDKITAESTGLLYLDFARAVIAADRKLNK